MHYRRALSPLALALALSQPALAEVLKVDPQGGPFLSISDAAARARDGDTVEIAAGEYRGDVAVWTQKNLTLRAVGGPVRIKAAGTSAEGKGIWVVRGGAVRVEGIEFTGTRVRDRNGAGIRLDRGQLTVVHCRFIDNENGILTSGDAQSELTIESSEFANNGAGDGKSHNLYVGAIKRLAVSSSYFHHARVGHLIKSRAKENLIAYNRITDEIGGRASYELEFPNGGRALVVGNLIEQSSTTENSVMISFGAEGYAGRTSQLLLSHNTLVDDKPRNGIFLKVEPGSAVVRAQNNVLVGGNGRLDGVDAADAGHNFAADWEVFVQPQRDDYRLRKGSKLHGKAIAETVMDGMDTAPSSEYVHPLGQRELGAKPLNPGAFQSEGQ
ncbi:right-handed parallel beta-helix repeat-containing protein [Niveibacterium sp. SC-1]|uniref:right-handed parallel beta-helix repeat-containing protein n=1 Tax=Niveibacterium sp. SC-1 TaxID=3135646 RepID=UPI003120213C